MNEGYVLIWRYDDRSGEGYFNILFSEREKNILALVLDEIGDTNKKYTFIDVSKTVDLAHIEGLRL